MTRGAAITEITVRLPSAQVEQLDVARGRIRGAGGPSITRNVLLSAIISSVNIEDKARECAERKKK